MRRVSKVAVVAVTGALALTATACGSKPKDEDKNATPSAGSTGGGGANAANFTACMVTDQGGVDDRSFNASSWKALQNAEKNLGIKIKKADSKTENDYVPNLDSMVGQNCNVIVAVGGLMAKATSAAAAKNPNQKFIIVDSTSEGQNIKGLEYNTAQAAFMGGYLAAAQSKTGKVGTFGGKRIQPVTIYMDGFWEGVQYYNQQKGKNVQVLGWDENNQGGGQFADKFDSPADGQRIAKDLISQGADIIHPVAGATGTGAAAEAQQSGRADIVWVDVDGYESANQYKDVMLSTVTKAITDSLYIAIQETLNNQYSTKPYLGTLANNGTGLAPFHDFDSQVTAETKAELEKIKQDIVAGKIAIKSPNQPKAS